jgi:hypothetical protein
MEWHDAVAIAAQLAEQVLADKRRPAAGSVPSMTAILLEADGRLRVRLDSSGSESLAAGVGRVLQAFLQDKPSPANLRLLAWQAIDAATPLALERMAEELVRWERPGRIAKLKELYVRAQAAGPPRPLPVVAPPVVEAPVAVPPPPDATPAAKAAPAGRAGLSKRQIGQMAAAALACIAAGGIGAWFLSSPDADAPAPTRTVVEAATSPSPATQGNSDGAADTRAPAPRPGRKGDRRTTARTGPQQPAMPAAKSKAGSPASSARGASVTPSIAPPTLLSKLDRSILFPDVTIADPPPVLSSVARPAKPDTHVYRSGDVGVTDALLVRPYLPPKAQPEIPDTELGVLEVVVDQRGLVESVHLRSPANRYREKWWLFTAKDWRFEPARKDGTPVRFLKRILLTDLNITEPQ